KRMKAGRRVAEPSRVVGESAATNSRVVAAEITTRAGCAELTICVYYNHQSARNGCVSYPGDERGALSLTNAYRVGLISHSMIANDNITVTCREILTGISAKRDIVIASRVILEGIAANGRIAGSRRIPQSSKPNCSVVVTSSVAK